ncbi:hypothetical protein [Halocola ammonii]
MKKIITTIAFSFLALICFSQVSNNTVMVRVVETWRAVSAGTFQRIDSEIVISFPNGENEVVELDREAIKNFHSNTKKIHETLDPFFSDGYELLSEQSAGGEYWSTQTWIFRKIETK